MLFEELRDISIEKSLLDVPTQYGGAGSWQTLVNYGNITLTEDSLVIFSYKIGIVLHGGSAGANHRLKIESVYVSGCPKVNEATIDTFTGLIYLAAGTYAVVAECCDDSNGSTKWTDTYISEFKLGIVKLSDTAGSAAAIYSSSISKTIADRKTILGDLKNAVMYVQVLARCDPYYGYSSENFENPGESLVNAVTITVDGVQQSWTERYQDNVAGTSTTIYGAGTGKLVIPLSVGTSHTVTITHDDAYAIIYVSVAFSPWILGPTDTEILDLDFSQGSTLYLAMEPLMANPTKFVDIGKKRAVSFGDSTDYYSSASGVDIVNHSYTFDYVSVVGCVLTFSGFGGCISMIGVDMR